MALRTKTVEYAFPLSIASVATAVARTFTTITVNIPETTSRTFRSVVLEYSMRDTGTAASLTAVNMSAQVNAVAASAATITQTITNSGESQSFVFTKDITAYFQTNFTGTTNTVTSAITLTGAVTINASCRLFITYEYDDSAATTRIKTVKIPIDGNTSNLGTALVNLGGVANQIPNLSTFLPEASKVYRSIFFVWETHTGGSASSTATSLDISYDGGTTIISDTAHSNNNITSVFYRRIDDLTATLNTSATGSVQARSLGTTVLTAPCLCGHLVVTYEYNHSTSTRIMNSIQLAVMDEAALTGGPTTNDKSRFQRDISIQEPGTITLEQSGVFVSLITSIDNVLDLRVGSQPSGTFAQPSSMQAGSQSAMRRFDSGAAGGAGMTLARGTANSFQLDWFASGTTVGTIPSNVSGLLFLNYTSDKHSLGDAVHNHTTLWCISPYATNFTGNSALRIQVTAATTPNIPETDYWLSGFGYRISLTTNGSAAGNLGYAVLAEVQSTEAEGAGWRALYSAMYLSDVETGHSLCYARAHDDFQRWPQDPDTSRLNIENARSYRFDCTLPVTTTLSVISQAMAIVTYHAITYEIAGTISGSNGGTVVIDAHRTSDGIRVAETSRVGNGTFTMPWYDNTIPVYVEAYEDGAHIGRSDNALAV